MSEIHDNVFPLNAGGIDTRPPAFSPGTLVVHDAFMVPRGAWRDGGANVVWVDPEFRCADGSHVYVQYNHIHGLMPSPFWRRRRLKRFARAATFARMVYRLYRWVRS